MKKLMFTAAVAAGLAAFGTGIESANTVGYQEKELTFGGNAFVIQTFLPMDKTVSTTKLGDISVTDEWDPTGDLIATLTPEGANAAEYTYLIKDYAEALGGEAVAGWYMAEEMNDGIRIDNTLRGGINLNKVVTETINGSTTPNDSNEEFEFTITLHNDAALFEGEQIPWYIVN